MNVILIKIQNKFSMHNSCLLEIILLLVILGIYPNELKMDPHRKTYAWIFIAASFIITKLWK